MATTLTVWLEWIGVSDFIAAIAEYHDKSYPCTIKQWLYGEDAD